MILRKKFLSALCVVTVLLLAACAGGGNSTNAPVNAPANSARPANAAAPATTPAAATTPASGSAATGTTQTGIPACDDYLAKVESCFINNPNVPEQIKATYRSTMDQQRTAWKAAADNARAQTEATCRQAMESAKPSFDRYCK